MNKLFILVLGSSIIVESYSMDSFFQKIAGEKVIKYVLTKPEQQEKNITIVNQTDGIVQLRATYDCNTVVSYPSIWCIARCWTTRTMDTVTACQDDPLFFNHGQALEISPVLPDIFKSRIRLVALKAQLRNSAEWIDLTLPQLKNSDSFKSYQGLAERKGDEMYILLQDGQSVTLQ